MGLVPRPIQMINLRVLSVAVLVFGVNVNGYTQNIQPIIHSIHISGNHFYTQRAIVNLMNSQTDTRYDEMQVSRDLDQVYHAYAENGFYFAEARIDSFTISSDNRVGDLWISVNEGDRVSIDTIFFTGNTHLSGSTLLDKFQTRAGQYLLRDILEHDLNTMLTEYEQNGYPFASVGIQAITPVDIQGTNRLKVIIWIKEGKRVTVDEVKIVGNTVTRNDVIVREMRLNAHEPFDERKISKISTRLKRLNIFIRIDPPEPFATDTGGGVLVHVTEGNTNTFDGVLGYAPAAKTSDHGVVSGIVNVSMRNLFGTARKASIHWLRDEHKSQEIALAYTEPWVMDFPLDIGLSFYQRQQDSTYVKRKFGITADLLLSESLIGSGTFSQEYVIPSNGVEIVPSSKTSYYGVSIRYDSRDDLLCPTSGIFYSTDYQVGRKTGNAHPSTIQRISFDAAYFVQPFIAQVAAITLHARSLYGGGIDISDLFRLGGTNTLRGYRENQFLGSRIAWTNLEYRFILAPRSFVFGFFDAGYYYRDSINVAGMSGTHALKYGYGFGIRLETSLGNIGMSFGFGEGDTFSQGKVHIGLVNEF
jgi:outer membrane protein insertion porin family